MVSQNQGNPVPWTPSVRETLGGVAGTQSNLLKNLLSLRLETGGGTVKGDNPTACAHTSSHVALLCLPPRRSPHVVGRLPHFPPQLCWLPYRTALGLPASSCSCHLVLCHFSGTGFSRTWRHGLSAPAHALSCLNGTLRAGAPSHVACPAGALSSRPTRPSSHGQAQLAQPSETSSLEGPPSCAPPLRLPPQTRASSRVSRPRQWNLGASSVSSFTLSSSTPAHPQVACQVFLDGCLVSFPVSMRPLCHWAMEIVTGLCPLCLAYFFSESRPTR